MAIMKEDIGKFVYDSMQQMTKKDRNHEKASLRPRVYFFTKTCFVACEVHVYAMAMFNMFTQLVASVIISSYSPRRFDRRSDYEIVITSPSATNY